MYIWSISLSLLLLLGQVVKGQDYFIDPGVVLVDNWEGWGTSLAWWADVLGGMNDPVVDEISAAFFHPDKLNLNIVRYVIGGTTPEYVTPYPCGAYRDGAASETFQDGPGLPFNWTRDARQRKVLGKAKALGVNIFEAFSNSPPQWMTISGCSKGNPAGFPLHANFQADQAPAFSEYVTEVLKYFHEVENITFEYFEPFNEPMGLAGIGAWWGEASSQEGCNINRQTMAATIRSLFETLQAKGMDYVTITAADETQVNTAVDTANYFVTQGISHMYTKLNVHGYWDLPANRRDSLNIIAHKGGQKLWMDEMGWGESPLNDMTQGFEIANRILDDIRGMLPSAWVYWQVMEGIGSWGLLAVPYRDDVTVNDIQYNSGYYAMLQFSHYIKQGYKIIEVSDKNSIAAFHDESSTLVLVTVHQSNSSTSIQNYYLSSFSTNTATISSATRTSPLEQNAPISSNEFTFDGEKGFLEIQLPPESISTIVLTNIAPRSSSPLNLIGDGDFVSGGGSSPWEYSDGSLIDMSFPWRGNWGGTLNKNSDGSDATLSQSFIVPSGDEGDGPRILYLTFWGSSIGINATTLEVYVAGVRVQEIKFNERIGYRLYSLHFIANVGDEVKLIFIHSGILGSAHVDDVKIHYTVFQN